jgi:hypothetical protein
MQTNFAGRSRSHVDDRNFKRNLIHKELPMEIEIRILEHGASKRLKACFGACFCYYNNSGER